jgi:hypothetical protein
VTDPQRHYRRLLSLYPKEYREVHGEEMLGTLLDISSERGRFPMVELPRVLLHAVRVRLRISLSRPGRIPLPQPARLVTWMFAALSAIDWYSVIFYRHGPKNPGPNWNGIVSGVVFLGLSLLVLARRRLLYSLAASACAALSILVFIEARPHLDGLMIAAPYIAASCLLFGWRRRYLRFLIRESTQVGVDPIGRVRTRAGRRV